MKTVKVNHVVLTLNIAPGGLGEPRDEIDRKVNARLAEGYDEVEIFPIRSNFNESGSVTDIVQLYVFKQYEVEVPYVKAKKE